MLMRSSAIDPQQVARCHRMFTSGDAHIAAANKAEDQFVPREMITADVVIVAADQVTRTRHGQEDFLMQRIGGGEQRYRKRRTTG